MLEQRTNIEQFQEGEVKLADEQLEGLRILARLIGRRALEEGRLAKEARTGQTDGNSFAGRA